MSLYKKIFLHFKYRKKVFYKIGKFVDYKQNNSKFIYSENISIGDYSKILDGAFFDGVGGIEVGECTVIAPNCTIITSNHNYKSSEFLPYDNSFIMKKVKIEDYCWIGRNVLILPGVTIGKASIVAAGSVVTKSIPEYSIYGGNPATLIQNRDIELTENLIKEKKCCNNKNININNKKTFKEN
jgi:acetyltransferase-like isoleucine patch superfamily enzyme